MYYGDSCHFEAQSDGSRENLGGRPIPETCPVSGGLCLVCVRLNQRALELAKASIVNINRPIVKRQSRPCYDVDCYALPRNNPYNPFSLLSYKSGQVW